MGILDVDAMLSSIPSSLFLEWMAYNNVEPIGEERGDLRAGIIACTIANIKKDPKTQAFKISDFMPKFLPKYEEDEEFNESMNIIDKVLFLAKAFNAKIIKRSKS